ncbi:MAG: aldehyde dehydrogenase family protein [Thermoleophilia bacterium]
MDLDHDLRSIQEARALAGRAKAAQKTFAGFTQQQVDRVCEAMAEAAFAEAERLGQLAYEDTGYGIVAHKRLKNEFASRHVWARICAIPTVGVIDRDEARGLVLIGWPMGVICALSPSTNPTSTVIYKTIISVKARNGIVHAPHPSAIRCCNESIRVMAKAGVAAGMPDGLIGCMENVSLPGTEELMKHRDVDLILATGGTPMVRAAHSAGKPALGVGPGNVPCYVDRSADLEKAARYIVSSKAFDCSVICATEQAVVADRPIAGRLAERMQELGAHFVDEQQAAALARVLYDERGAFNPRSVGQTPQKLAQMAGISVPSTARILVARLDGVGPGVPLSREKLTTVLGWYDVDGWEEGCRRSIELLTFGGEGHTQVIHATDPEVILRFGLEKPAFRVLVNAMGTLGAIGLTTGLDPALTLAPGGIGGAITGDNVGVRHLLNVKRLAWDIADPPAAAMVDGLAAAAGSPAAGLGAPPMTAAIAASTERPPSLPGSGGAAPAEDAAPPAGATPGATVGAGAPPAGPAPPDAATPQPDGSDLARLVDSIVEEILAGVAR